MKLLVTGRTGQVVRSLVERAAGHRSLKIISIGRPEVNLELPGALADAIRAVEPDVVINAAALTAVDEAEGEAERAFRVNAEAAGEAAAVARAIGAPIIQIS